MIKVISFFLTGTSSGRGMRARLATCGAIVISLLGGAANIALLTLISSMLSGANPFRWKLVWMIVVLGLVLGLTRGIAQYLLSVVTLEYMVDLRLSFCTHLTSAPLATLERMGKARLMAAFTDSMPAISSALLQLPNVVLYTIVTAGSIIYLGYLSWQSLAIIASAGACFLFAYRRVNALAQREFGIAFGFYRAVMKGFGELVDGIKELKAHRERRSEHLSIAIAAPLEGLAKHRKKSSGLYGIAEAWFTSGMFISIAIILVVTRGQQKNVGTGFIVVLLYLLPFVQGIIATFPNFAQAQAAIASLSELTGQLAGESDITVAPVERGRQWSRLILQNITYQYVLQESEASFRIGPIDLTLLRGETVFITGGNGSGKTTLMKVMTGLYRPQEGAIFVDSVAIGEGDIDTYRHLFSAVYVDFHLFDQLYGLKETDQDAAAYLRHLKLDHKISVEQGRLSTISLSQGQKKRLALLTAYLEDRPIYVFDEWAADQDVEFRDFFYHEILPGLRRRGKTILVITHDDRYFHLADRLIRMEVGRIVQDGSLRVVAEDSGADMNQVPVGQG